MPIKKQPIIKVSAENFEKLMAANNAGRTTTYMALRYASQSAKAEKIRKDAMQFYGGVKTTKTLFL